MRMRTTGAVAAVLAALGLSAYAAWKWWPGASEVPAAPASAAPDDPRLTYPTPFRNVRPGVKYVGDQVCAGCHAGVAETFHHHPMGRSFAPTARVADLDRYDEAAHNPFDKFGYRYTVERRGDRVFHKEARPGADGRPVVETVVEAKYAVGSGTRGRTYLIERDGYLFQSPISWYSQQGIWDLSPGYGEEEPFERPILPGCLACHANDADAVEGTLNRHRQPV